MMLVLGEKAAVLGRSPHRVAISFSIMIAMSLILLSAIGILAPAENIARVPLTFFENIFGGASRFVDTTVAEIIELRTLRERNRELEEALAAFQAEVAESREIRSDYDRLAALVNYTTETSADRQYVAADVIGQDSLPTSRTFHIDRGTRDGVAVGDPVVTELGLVGRVTKVTATGAEVLLINDQVSSINVRLQSTRDRGLIQGTISGDLILRFLETNAEVIPGDLVVTSGETQTFPADLVVGQIGNPTLSEDRLFQETGVVSFIDFSRLEIVLVITNWEPVDLSAFDDEATN